MHELVVGLLVNMNETIDWLGYNGTFNTI